MRAHAVVVAEPSDRGGAFSTLRSDPPLLLRPTPDALYLQGGAAGPLGGDQLRLDIHVTAGARLVVRSVAATVVLPGATASCLRVTVRLDEGARLDWRPEPLVSVVGSRHRQRADIAMAASASLRWHDCLVLGRTDERSGSIDSSIRIDRAGEPLFHQDLLLGEPNDELAWRNAAVIGSGRVVAGEVTVGMAASEPPTTRHDEGTGARVARLPLAPDATLVQAVGPDVSAVDRMMSARYDGLSRASPSTWR